MVGISIEPILIQFEQLGGEFCDIVQESKELLQVRLRRIGKGHIPREQREISATHARRKFCPQRSIGR